MAFAEALAQQLHRRALDLPPELAARAHETREPAIYGFMGGFTPLAFIIVCLRLYSRWRFTSIGKDDVLVVISMVLYLGLVIATIFAAKYGLGHHIWTITEEAGVLMQKCGFSSQVLYPPALGAVKLSIVLFFIRCLPVVHDQKAFLWGFAAFIFVEEAAFTIALFNQCKPLNFYWDKSIEGGTCFDQPAFYYADAAFNLATDLVILSLPWVLFRKLNVSKRQKYMVVAICSLGVFTLISSLLRLPYLHDLNKSTDPTWSVPNIVIWSIAELGSAISLSSIPAIRPLYAHLFLKKTAHGSSSDGSDIKKPKRTAKSNLPFSVNTISSIADKSAWKNQVQMFSLKSDKSRHDQSHIGTQRSESQDHIVAEEGKSQNVTSTAASVEIKEDVIEMVTAPAPAVTRR